MILCGSIARLLHYYFFFFFFVVAVVVFPFSLCTREWRCNGVTGFLVGRSSHRLVVIPSELICCSLAISALAGFNYNSCNMEYMYIIIIKTT